MLELWRYDQPGEGGVVGTPNKSELYVEAEVLESARLMNSVLAKAASIAFETGAKTIELPCPSSLAVDEALLGVRDRSFAFAWMRKNLGGTKAC